MFCVLLYGLVRNIKIRKLLHFLGNLRKSIRNSEFITLTINISNEPKKSLIIMTIKIIESKSNNTDDFVIITKKARRDSDMNR